MRTLFLLLVSCVSCFAQFGVEQPMFQLSAYEWPQQQNLVTFYDTLGGSNNFELSGSRVTNWYNKATASDPARAINANQRPVFVSASSPGTLGDGYVEFYGTNSLEFYPTNAAYFTTPCTFAMVFISWGVKADMAYTGTSDGGLGFHDENSYAPGGLSVWSGSRISNAVRTGSNPQNTFWYRVVGIFGGSGPNASITRFWTNGVYVGDYDISSSAVPIAPPWRLGRSSDVFGNWAQIPIARFMLWKGALTSNECQTVGAKLKTDFGL